EQPLRFTGIEQRQQVRVLQVRRDADLAEEPLSAEYGTQLWTQHLERDFAIVPDVGRQVHGGHAAGTKLTLDFVATDEGRVQLGDRSHGKSYYMEGGPNV